MESEQERVIVLPCGSSGVGVQLQHRDFPEIRAEGASPGEASIQLVNHLTRALDSALTVWRRETIQKAIAEVQEFSAHVRA